MNTILENSFNEIEIKKSKFFTFLIKSDDSNVENQILEIKKIYKGANHYCYAYIINNKEKAYDDGEPSGTAGLPILNVLKKNNLTNVLCIVVRYFGGVKLGSGGLIRAYSSCVSECLAVSNIIPFIVRKKVLITFNYDSVDYIDKVLSDFVLEKEFSDLVSYLLLIDENFDFGEFDKFLIEKKDA